MSTTTRTSPASGVGVLDKASIILSLIEQQPTRLSELVRRSGLSRPTVYRLAVAMERLDLLARDGRGWFAPGPRLERLSVEGQFDRMVHTAAGLLTELRERTSFGARLHRLHKGVHVCVASSTDPATGEEALPLATARPVNAGPIGQVLLAWGNAEEIYERLHGARFTAQQLALVRRRGWAHGPDDAAPGHVALAVPVWNRNGRVVAALVLSGRRSRLSGAPDRLLRAQLIDAAAQLGMESPERP